MSDHDVYSFGVIASSIHYAIRGPFPQPEGYAEIVSVNQMIGGDSLLRLPAISAVDTRPRDLHPWRAGEGWDDARLVKFSAAVAAIVCTRTPGALNAPGYDETLAFMGLRQR